MGVCNLQEETDWECGSNDEDTDDEEIKAGAAVRGANGAGADNCKISGKEMFPVLAPPQQFQNCLSPSATYEV